MKMEKFWIKAVQVTGAVGVVGFLFSIIIKNVFEEKIIQLFGSQNVFYLVVAITVILGVALILAILRHRGGEADSKPEEKTNKVDENKTANITNSKIDGDIVFGNKTINRNGDSDK